MHSVNNRFIYRYIILSQRDLFEVVRRDKRSLEAFTWPVGLLSRQLCGCWVSKWPLVTGFRKSQDHKVCLIAVTHAG